MSSKEVRIPKQARSIEKKNIIKKAALDLITELGYHKTTTNEIAKRAGLSIGTFYSYFTDKLDVYDELVKDLFQGVIDQIPDITPDEIGKPEQTVRSLIKIVLKAHIYMPQFQREVSCLSSQYEEFRAIEYKYKVPAAEKIANVMQFYKEQLRITDFETSLMIIMNSIEAVIHDIAFYTTNYDNDKVIEELSDMLCRYALKPEALDKKK